MNNQTLLFSVLTAEGVILIGLCALFYQLLKQQGRILLRVDSLEQNAPPGFAASAEDTECGPTGLSVGTQFPAFRYFDLAGKVVELTDIVGKRTLIVHWSTGCSAEAFAPAGAQISHPARQGGD